MNECKHDGGFDLVKTENGEVRDTICCDCGYPLMMIISELQDCIEELRAENEQLKRQWVSVEEMLPEDGRKVLVVGGMFPHNSIQFAYFINGKWCSGDTQYILQNQEFTHWMPLPEPPKETNNDRR